MQPVLESIQPNPGSSFFIEKYHGDNLCRVPFWHIHPEYEIVFIKSGSGTRCIGGHFSTYTNGDLIMLGPNLPHQPFSNNETPNNEEIVIQFGHQFFTRHLVDLPESQAIATLFERSKQGISFPTKVKKEIGKQLYQLIHYSPLEKLLAFIKILHQLAETTDYRLLQAGSMALEIKSNDHQRMNLIYNLVSENYTDAIDLKDLAEICGLTIPSFCRFFKKVTGKTFIHFLNEYRVVKAQELLSRKNDTISSIMHLSGFNDLAYFSKLFKKHTGYSPTSYKKRLQNTILRYD